MNTHWIRIFGSLLIFIGVSVFVGSLLAAFGMFVYSLFAAQDYVSAVTLTSISLIIFGFALRKIFREPPEKL
jgi:ABC-type transporter Mla maintaining outer membrane lipid asymmetry permease subunit MlaE